MTEQDKILEILLTNQLLQTQPSRVTELDN